jgi:hypothetical protein
VELTKIERQLLKGFEARDREVQRAIAALREDFQDMIQGVEKRLELPPGSVGMPGQPVAYVINPETGVIVQQRGAGQDSPAPQPTANGERVPAGASA